MTSTELKNLVKTEGVGGKKKEMRKEVKIIEPKRLNNELNQERDNERKKQEEENEQRIRKEREERERQKREEERLREEERKREEENLKKYTIEKLIEFISKDNKPIQLYSEDGLYKFIEIMSEDIGEKILIYIPSKYPILNSVKYPSLQLTSISEEETFKHPSSKQLREYSEIKLDNETIEEQLLDKDEADRLVGYQDIDIDDKEKIKMFIQISHSQLERFSLCTKRIKYKFGIVSKQVLSIINRHNDINHFLITDELKFKSENVSKMNENDRELCVIVDLESYYNKISSFSSDIRKIYVNLYTILNKVHSKELSELNNKLSLFNPLVSEAINKYKKHQDYLAILNKTTNKISLINKKIKEVDENIPKVKYNDTSNEASKSFQLEKLTKEGENLRVIRSKSIKLYTDIKNTYNNGMLNFDSALMNSLLSLDDLINNFTFLGLLKNVRNE
jgi:hypothetical protein